ncbi:MAG: hypothetical protein FWF96_05240, partial [Kiritimatiellaeota bacterium]|nr:hypothetical protein [Kiritimatiellota bacterium]
MKSRKFVDRVTVQVRSGKGGDGSKSFRREKYIDRGGPDGGDGGRGGHVIFLGDSNTDSLQPLFFESLLFAPDGGKGAGQGMHGADGKDLVRRVPCGTQIFDNATGGRLADITEHGQAFTAARGGAGGLGNVHFKTSTNQAPERFTPGKPDARCDIYSLGVMLYRILVNQLPRDVGKISFKEFRRRLADFPVVPPRQRDPGLPRDLEAIVMKALRENPDERYRTVGELAGDLERFLDILPVSAYREGWYGHMLKFVRRHRATAGAGAVMLVAILFTGAAAIRTQRLAAETEAAERRVEEERGRL